MAGSFLLRQRKFRQIFDREERRYRKHAYENAATPSVLPPMFHRTTSRLPLVLGSRKRFCEAKDFLGKGRESAFLAFRAPAKIACRVLREEERQAYKVMRQTKRAADQTALPRRGVALTICELRNAPLFGAFQGSRADAKQMRGKRSSAVSTAREGAALSEGLPRQRDGGVVKSNAVTEGVIAAPSAPPSAPFLTDLSYCFARLS